MSNVLVVIYGLTLLFLGLGELALITSGGAAKVTHVAFGLPAWTLQALTLTVMVLIALRLWAHLRARKAASAKSLPKVEDDNS